MIIENLMTQLDEDAQKNVINVSRHMVIQGARRAFNKYTFNPRAAMSVKFVGEQGIDAGGPTREFMTLCLKAIQDSVIFHGEGEKFLAKSVGGETTILFIEFPIYSDGQTIANS